MQRAPTPGTQLLRRRQLGMLLAGATVLVAGCGFALRTSQKYAFDTIAITPERAGGVAGDLSRYLGDIVRPVAPPHVILDVLQELRQKVIVGVNASGQVREFELHLKVQFKVRTPKGVDLINPTYIEQVRNISFNESAVLSKEAEEALLYRDMQADVVQQLVRRLVTVRMPVLPGTAVPALNAASAPAAGGVPGVPEPRPIP